MNPVNFLINIAIPVMILLNLSSPSRLGPLPAVLLAVGIPLTWGLVEFIRHRRMEPSSVLGFLSVLATGVIAVFELDPRFIALKEAAIPFGFALVLLISNQTKFPISTLLADMVLRRDRVRTAVDEQDAKPAYHQHLVRIGTIWATIMVLSGTIKFLLGIIIVQSPAGTEAFNHELARYELWQLPTSFSLTGVLILSLIWYIANGTSAITGQDPAEILRGGAKVERMARRLAPIANRFDSLPHVQRAITR